MSNEKYKIDEEKKKVLELDLMLNAKFIENIVSIYTSAETLKIILIIFSYEMVCTFFLESRKPWILPLIYAFTQLGELIYNYTKRKFLKGEK